MAWLKSYFSQDTYTTDFTSYDESPTVSLNFSPFYLPPGCSKWNFESATEDNASAPNTTEAPSNTATETETPPPEATTPECWPSMCAGSELVEVYVACGFVGDVVLSATCQNKELSIQPGGTVQINRG